MSHIDDIENVYCRGPSNEIDSKDLYWLINRVRALTELVSLAKSFMAEEDVAHYSTAVTFKMKCEALEEKL